MPALVYDAQNERVRFLFRWRRTLLPLVLSDPMFWVLMTVHVTFLYLENSLLTNTGTGLPTLEWNAASAPVALCTFFVVFYGQSCFKRFYDFYEHCTVITGCIAEWAFLVKTHFNDMPAPVRWNLMRPMLASMQMHYAHLGGGDDTSEKVISEEEWASILEHDFICESEKTLLKCASAGGGPRRQTKVST